MKNKCILFLALIFMHIFFVSCKSDAQLSLESAIDEFEYLRYQEPLQTQKIENLKSKFEKLSNDNADALYYLSEISRLQNKIQESHDFISEAYAISHADSIYQQKKNIESLLPSNIKDTILIEERDSKEILIINDNILVFKTNKNYAPFHSELNSTNNQDNTITQLIKTGREDVQKLYEAEQYVSAINNTKMLIQLIMDLEKEELTKKELSQLYQDLAILYAKNNNVSQANIAIDKAIELNPTKENKEIKTLINN